MKVQLIFGKKLPKDFLQPKDLVDLLLERYDVAKETAMVVDAKQLAAQWIKAGIIRKNKTKSHRLYKINHCGSIYIRNTLFSNRIIFFKNYHPFFKLKSY